MEDFVNFLQAFLNELLVLIAPIVAGFVVAALRALTKKWLGELEASKPVLAEILREGVSLAVQAAEQAGAAGFVEDKKAYAFSVAQTWLEEQGWGEIDIYLIEAAIEAEVNRLYPNEGAKRVSGVAGLTDW